MTKAMRNYVDLHRHAAVRAALLTRPKVALRLMVAHAIAGSGLWQVSPDPQRAESEANAESIAASTAHAAFAEERKAILVLLGMDEETANVAQPMCGVNVEDVFVRLNELSDKDVLRSAAFVMAETLEAGSRAVEVAGVHLAVDMTARWQPDEAFFALLREKALINPMLAEVAGAHIANARIAEKAQTQKQVLHDCLLGADGRGKSEPWSPRWMRFPAGNYGAAKA